jgi:hypothetical protein
MIRVICIVARMPLRAKFHDTLRCSQLVQPHLVQYFLQLAIETGLQSRLQMSFQNLPSELVVETYLLHGLGHKESENKSNIPRIY